MNSNIINNIIGKYLNCIENGVFVECGAIDGVYRSLTKVLYDCGWRGYNFEPNPITYEKLIKNRKEDVNLNLCLWNCNGFIEFYIPKGHKRGYETGGGSLLKSVTSEREFIVKNIESITFDVFIERYSINNIDFMVLDVEGAELEVLSTFQHSKTRPHYLLVEIAHIDTNKLYEILNNYYIEDNDINVGWENKLFVLK